MPDATEEWIFLDMNLLKEVIAPSLRLAIKLQHDEHRILSSSGTLFKNFRNCFGTINIDPNFFHSVP